MTWIARWVSMLLIITFLITFNIPWKVNADYIQTDIQKIEEYVQAQQAKGKIPGLAVVVIQNGETVYKKSIGYARIESKVPVTNDTLFEIGSNTKAFTGLAVLQLAEQGKIRLTDSVNTYLPWFQATYEGMETSITLAQLLHHTSGIPFSTIAHIPQSHAEDALEKNIRKLSGIRLSHEPGKQFEYATINYDVLGLVIEKVSSVTYQHYIEQQILKPLGLTSTWVGRKGEIAASMAGGYKLAFGAAKEYHAPEFNGNTPAGYIISNLNDMEKWLRIQTKLDQQQPYTALLQRSHEPDRTVKPRYDGSSYAVGWAVFQEGTGLLAHSGSNPNYSSYIAFRPHEGTGVAILANINSDMVPETGAGIMQLLTDGQPTELAMDSYAKLDRISTVIIGAAGLGSLAILWCSVRLMLDVLQRKRKVTRPGLREGIVLMLATFLTLAYEVALFNIPNILFSNLNWSFVLVWAPLTVSIAGLLLGLIGILYYIYFVLSRLLRKSDDRFFFHLIVLSVISGLANSALILSITQSLQTEKQELGRLFLYFALFVVIYLFGQKYIRSRLVGLTNSFLLQKREEMIGHLMNASFQRVESIHKSNIYTTLNHDMETVSRTVNAMVTAVTNSITILICLVYLGFIQIQGLMLSLAVIVVALLLYMRTGQSARRFWEEIRDLQTAFYKLIEDMVSGFRELSLHHNKRTAFFHTIVERCREIKDLRTKGDMKFVNTYVLGELMFVIVLGVTVFLLPVLIHHFQIDTMLHFVLVFLYIMGPVNGLLNTIPQLIQVRISWKRIIQLNNELKAIPSSSERKLTFPSEKYNVSLNQVSYQYPGESPFRVGPLQGEFRSGEITFVIGGNGSGKSTLANLLTGLYEPSDGCVLINGKQVSPNSLGEYYSVVYSNYYLFDRLYGLSIDGREAEIESYLDLLELKDKVFVNKGEFSTTKLSSGQRKRLALLVCYLEDRPIYLFDEWAADQDPRYRQIFYHKILPELKRKGKCIIAITHDERYFHVADQVVKMEAGAIIHQGRPYTEQLESLQSGTMVPG
ncbi:cyclic peptide export ABC transporter [Paenibacillus oleatilyticus]|uniref:Cyclic peptide export ABC transporter n=1 Tax=Paenibacillus oleatilyticus TaxID=2594886 RepID=A0ABV4VA54_9BACL